MGGADAGGSAGEDHGAGDGAGGVRPRDGTGQRPVDLDGAGVPGEVPHAAPDPAGEWGLLVGIAGSALYHAGAMWLFNELRYRSSERRET